MLSSFTLTADGYQFVFHNVIDAYVFDDKDPSSPHFHEGSMKAVDIIAEFSDCFLFIEMKDYRDCSEQFIEDVSEKDDPEANKALKWLKNYLKYKFRDTYLYRYAEAGSPKKDIHYICLLSLSSGTLQTIKKTLPRELPIGKKGKRWIRVLAKSCQVVSVEGWNRTLSEYATVTLV